MTWQSQPATERPVGDPNRPSQKPAPNSGSPVSHRLVHVGRTVLPHEGKEIDIYTMTIDGETIDLLPLRNWGQLDVYKWTMRGKLPGTPPGLEISADHVKLAGEVVSAKDPEGQAKLEKLVEEWLALEKQSLELARRKSAAKTQPLAATSPQPAELQMTRFEVELDKRGQVHVRCVQGKEVLATIGLNVPGFHNLVNQGYMRKPHAIKAGALHDWVELDGVLYSFEHGKDESSRLAQALNTTYAPTTSVRRGKDIVIFENAASSTGFDIQFPTMTAGVVESRRRPLNEECLELLQDSVRTALLQPGLIIKLSRPNFIFKQKTPDGGERYLDKSPHNLVQIADDDGGQKTIDLSQPVNYLHLSAVELTAVFNHPAINKHGRLAVPGTSETAVRTPEAPPCQSPAPTIIESAAVAVLPRLVRPTAGPPEVAPAKPISAAAAPPPVVREAKPLPNIWLKAILAQPPIRYDWFDCLAYRMIAERFGNSRENKIGNSSCWIVALGDVQEFENPDFKGFFMAADGGVGYLERGRLARFRRGVCYLGTPESGIEGPGVDLQAIGVDTVGRIIFVVRGDYLGKFGVAGPPTVQEWLRSIESGARILTVQEVLNSLEPLEIVWSVPEQQPNPIDPQGVESLRPDSLSADSTNSLAATPALCQSRAQAAGR
jgi:hypothetical protein